jgi:hypothetical protein
VDCGERLIPGVLRKRFSGVAEDAPGGGGSPGGTGGTRPASIGRLGIAGGAGRLICGS